MINHNPEIEEAILGNCICSKETLVKLIDIGVTADDFYSTNNQKIYNGLINTFSKNKAVDIVLLTRELKGEVYPSSLTAMVESSIRISDVRAHVDILLDLSIRRKYERLGKEIQSAPIADIGLFVKQKIDEIERTRAKINDLSTITTLDKIDYVDIYKLEKVKTGFFDIDKRILGFVMGSLDIITGYNGNGKSTLINQMCIAESLAEGYKVFAYSPELTNSNFKNWLYPTICDETHFVEKKFVDETYKIVGNQGIKLIDEWIKDKLYIYADDSVTSSESQLLKDMEKLVKNNNVRVFIIDNLMKIDLEGGYKNELMAQKIFVNKLKEFARRYNVLVHLVAHPKKPQLGNEGKISKFDIAGSGDITNLADYVVAIKRVADEDRERDIANGSPIGLRDCMIKVMKDRPKGTNEFAINLNFDNTRRRFYSYNSEINKSYGYIPKTIQTQIDIENVFQKNCI